MAFFEDSFNGPGHEKLHCFQGITRFPPAIVGDPSDDRSSDADPLYEVRILDNDYNTYWEVMHITRLALGLTEDQAFAVAWEVDHAGSCVVAHAPLEQAEALAGIIRMIGIEVQVNPVGAGVQ